MTENSSGMALADQDEWRKRLRMALRPVNPERLRVLVREASSLNQPPASLLLLAIGLEDTGDQLATEDWLRRAVESRPQDFAICMELASGLLNQKSYWEFPARLYTGPTKTKLRFRLDRGSGQPAIYSNEFDGEVATIQFDGD
jgi:hypothetical protein